MTDETKWPKDVLVRVAKALHGDVRQAGAVLDALESDPEALRALLGPPAAYAIYRGDDLRGLSKKSKDVTPNPPTDLWRGPVPLYAIEDLTDED